MKFQVFHLSSSLQTTVFFFLVLLVQPPRGLMLPRHHIVYLSMLDNPEWEAAMVQLQASLRGPGGKPLVELKHWALVQGLEYEDILDRVQEVLPWRQQDRVKPQKREELGQRPMGTLSDNHIVPLLYPQVGEVEEGGEKRNEALTSIAGGLQAFNRQKGGFGFRFGRK